MDETSTRGRKSFGEKIESSIHGKVEEGVMCSTGLGLRDKELVEGKEEKGSRLGTKEKGGELEWGSANGHISSTKPEFTAREFSGITK